MIPDRDIDRAAKVIIERYSEDAPTHAAERADAMLEVGYLEGCAIWMRILRVIEELQRAGPKSGETVH